MNGLVQDLRYAFRQLRKSPGFACTAVLILALGIGASVAIFGFVDAALIKPLPYPNPNRLVDVTESVADDSARQPFLSRLSRLEEAQPCIQFYGGLHGRRLPVCAPPPEQNRCPGSRE